MTSTLFWINHIVLFTSYRLFTIHCSLFPTLHPPPPYSFIINPFKIHQKLPPPWRPAYHPLPPPKHTCHLPPPPKHTCHPPPPFHIIHIQSRNIRCTTAFLWTYQLAYLHELEFLFTQTQFLSMVYMNVWVSSS